MNTHVLILSPFIYPEPISTGKYNTRLAQQLSHLGCRVEVIAYHPFYPEWKIRKTNAKLKNIIIHRGGGLLPYPQSILLRRLQLELGFTFHSIRQIISQKEKDILLLIFPPTFFFLIIRLFLLKQTRKIGIVHDIQGVMAKVTTGYKKTFLISIIRYLEQKAYSKCDQLIFVSDSMAQRCIKEYGLNPEKVKVAYPFSTLKKENTSCLESIFAKGYKHVVYSGALGEKQNASKLAELFNRISNGRKDIMFHFFSRGPLFDKLERNYRRNQSILFHDLVPEKNLYELYLHSDVQIIPQMPGTSDGAIPSKLPNIIDAGVPVFAISDNNSDLANLINRSGIGYCATSWDIDILSNELNRFLSLSQKQTHFERQRKVRSFVAKHFSIHSLVKSIIE